MTIRKCCGYVRVSKEEQLKGYSMEFQAEELRRYAELHGYKLIHIYEEKAESAKDLQRTQFQKMIKDLYADKYDTILAWQVDRLARNFRDFVNLTAEIKEKNKNIIITTSGANTSNEADDFQFIFQGYVAELERKKILERTKAGMERRAKEGYYNGGKVLGYDSINKELVINEKESQIVETIFEMRADGKGYKSIALYLNKRGFKTKKGNPFSINSVKPIVNNILYTGKIRWGAFRNWSEKRRAGKFTPEIYDGKHKAIITEELWEKAQRVNKNYEDKKLQNKSVKGELLLTGLLRCPECGYGTVMSKSKGHYYYMCQQYHNKGKNICKTNLINRDFIEKRVEEVIIELLNNESIINEMIEKESSRNNTDTLLAEKQLKEIQDDIKAENNKLKMLDETFLNEMEKQNENAVQRYLELTEKIAEKIKTLEFNKETLEEEIREKKNNSLDGGKIKSLFKQFDKVYLNSDRITKKKLLRALIKKITVSKDRKHLESIEFWFFPDYRLPLSEIRRTLS